MIAHPFNLNDPALRQNPWPAYAHLRQTQPLAPTTIAPFGPGWLVARYADAVAILKDPRFSCNPRYHANGTLELPPLFRLLQNTLIYADGADHTRLRQLVHLAFTPKRVEALSAQVAQIAHTLLDQAAVTAPIDLITAFAQPLPLMVIAAMLGVPAAERQQFHRLFTRFLAAPGQGPLGLLVGLQLQMFLQRLMQMRRADPQDDLLTALVVAEQAGDHLNEAELLAMVFLLLVAGHETTVNLIGNGLLALLENPEQLQHLRHHPELSANAVEELLRFTSPVETATPRFAREAVVVQGEALPLGSLVMVLLAAANRDETVFAQPDQLDLTRHPNPHLAFGAGSHHCLGAPLARLEGQIAFRILLQRFPHMQLAVPPAQIQWHSAPGLRQLKALPLKLA